MGVDLGDRSFGEPVAEGQDFVVEIVFQLVPVQPILPDVDLRVQKYSCSVGSETVCDFSATDPCKKCPGKWEETCEDSS